MNRRQSAPPSRRITAREENRSESAPADCTTGSFCDRRIKGGTTYGAEFFAQLEKRFNQLPAEEKLDKIVEYQKKLTALKEQGLSEEEAVAQLESELPLPSPVPPENDEYGRISHPKKPLVTGTLYAVALAAVVAAAVLLSKIF